MIIVEYRIPMPFSAEEYRIAQLYTIAKKSKLESSDSKNGIKINLNEPYSNGPGGVGQYTNKTYYLLNRLPDWLKRLMPESAAKLKEEAWNAYPYSKNKFTNPLIDKLVLEIESRYLDGPPTLANAFNLEPKEEKARAIVMIDIVNDKYKSRSKINSTTLADHHQGAPYGELDVMAFDPLFRAPLSKDWLQECESAHDQQQQLNETIQSERRGSSDEFKKNLMTCYKLCRVNFPVWPIQNRMEQFIHQCCRDTMLEAHRQAWLWQDEWTGMSMDEIRLMESDTQSHLTKLMRQDLVTNLCDRQTKMNLI